MFSSKSNNGTSSFTASKPDVAIINLDGNTKITENLYKYIEKNANIKEIENDDDKIADSLFYEDVNAVIYIYDGYSEDFINNNEKNLEIKSGTNYYASYSNMLLERYFKIADIVSSQLTDQDKIIETINTTLDRQAKIEIENTLDTDGLSRASYFFSFSNYTILAICIYITAIVIFRFNDEKIKKRNMISNKSISSITGELYLGNLVFTFFVWLALIVLSFIIIGDTMATVNGLLLIINSLVFMTCGLSVGFLVGNILKSQNTISAAVTVISLGTSFICGSFIPLQYLPEAVVKISKILPSYWFIHNNDLIKTMEVVNINNVMPLLINMVIILVFSIIYIILTNIISKKIKK